MEHVKKNYCNNGKKYNIRTKSYKACAITISQKSVEDQNQYTMWDLYWNTTKHLTNTKDFYEIYKLKQLV